MRRCVKKLASCLPICLLCIASMAPAADHDMGGGIKPSSGLYPGAMIRHGSAQGYTLMYHLLNMKERNALMKGMEGMEMPGMSNSPDITNHLMVFIAGPGGHLASGTVGFAINAPDGRERKTLTMAMQGGYGADVSFKAKGIYKISMKAVIGDKTLIDEFTYRAE